MREIKFRVWDSRFNKYLNFYNQDDDVLINLKTGQIKGRYGGVGYVDSWHLEQYTGLKDKNGKEIYEGDIIKVVVNVNDVYDCNYFTFIKEVIFDTQRSCFGTKRKFTETLNEFIMTRTGENRCEVLGNIHQNPELLEV